MRLLSITLVVVLCNCAAETHVGEPLPQWRVEQTLASWREHRLPEGDCAARTGEVRVLLVEQVELQGLCQGTSELYGCLDGDVILVDEALVGKQEYNLTLEHELRHWMATCSYGFADHGHTYPSFWFEFDGHRIQDSRDWTL